MHYRPNAYSAHFSVETWLDSEFDIRNTALMEEIRWGEKWHIGDRIRYSHPDPDRIDVVEGVIMNRSWGRDKGRPIYHFTVRANGEEVDWVIGPDRVQPITEVSLPKLPAERQAPESESGELSADDTGTKYPVPPPEDTGFGPLDSDNWKEWRRDKRKWEAAQNRGGV